MLEMKDLVEKSAKDLMNLYQDLSREIYKLRCEIKINSKAEKPHLLRQTKRDRARVLTALQQKNVGKD